MALLPYADDNTASPKARELINSIPGKLNINRMLANSEPVCKAFLRMGGALMFKAQLDARLRELAILRTSLVSKAPYEWTQHVPVARQTGVTEAEIEAVKDWPKATIFSELDRAVLRLTDEVAAHTKGSHEAMETLKRYLSPREIVELVVSIGFWGMAARVMETIEVELEPGAGQTSPLANVRPGSPAGNR